MEYHTGLPKSSSSSPALSSYITWSLSGPSVKWVSTNPVESQDRKQVWSGFTMVTGSTSELTCGHTQGNQTLTQDKTRTQGGSPALYSWKKRSWTPSHFPCPDTTCHTDPGHTSLQKMERRCIFHRSQGSPPWPANFPRATTENTKLVRSDSITLVSVILLLKGVWGTWNIKKYLLD